MARLCHQHKTVGKAVRLTHRKDRIKAVVLLKEFIPISPKIREIKDYGENSPCLSWGKELSKKSISSMKEQTCPILISFFFLVFFFFSLVFFYFFPRTHYVCYDVTIALSLAKSFWVLVEHCSATFWDLVVYIEEREGWVGKKVKPSQNRTVLTCYEIKML